MDVEIHTKRLRSLTSIFNIWIKERIGRKSLIFQSFHCKKILWNTKLARFCIFTSKGCLTGKYGRICHEQEYMEEDVIFRSFLPTVQQLVLTIFRSLWVWKLFHLLNYEDLKQKHIKNCNLSGLLYALIKVAWKRFFY